MQPDLGELEDRLWDAADELRANSGLKASEYASPVLGLIFLRFADARFEAARERIESKGTSRRKIGPSDYQAEGLIYLAPQARYGALRDLPEGTDLGRAVNEAMRLIEDHNPALRGTLPHSYTSLPNETIASLLRHISSYTKDLEGDAFGLIYEYFLAKFALAEGQGAGEFFTPMSIVQLIVEVLEPFNGRIFDPACGSGGMFVHSAHFVERHRRSPGADLSIYGQEKTGDTVKLAKMNLAVHGLYGDIREANSYYEDPFDSYRRFDFVMANPPFNVDRIDKAKLIDDARVPDLPNPDNGNYIWIELFANSLNDSGRSGFVMANSSSDARHTEQAIRQKLIEEEIVDVMIAVGPNFFYTVVNPVTLWFLDRGKAAGPRGKQILFIDAREIFHPVDRTHREFTWEQIEFIANIVRLYRGEDPERKNADNQLYEEHFPDDTYRDVVGICKTTTIEEVAAQNWSLNPGRYVGNPVVDLDEELFREKLAAAQADLLALEGRARQLEEGIGELLTGLSTQQP